MWSANSKIFCKKYYRKLQNFLKSFFKKIGGIFMGLFGGRSNFFGGNATILFFIILFLLLFDGFGRGSGIVDP